MKVKDIPEEIREYLRYDNGKLFWARKPSKHVRVGDEAGHVNKTLGYKAVMFKRVLYYTHRVAWFLVTGKQPPEIVDHINNDKLDNRIENLRGATNRQNGFNAKISKRNTSGVKGIHWNRQKGKWQSYVHINNKKQHTGYFTDLEEATKAVQYARQQLHGDFANHGD